jgi:hypothetical protein
MPRIRPLQPGISRFSGYVRRLQRCCVRVEAELSARRLRVTDVELVYTSSFLAIVTRWESFLEASLYDAVCNPAPATLEGKRHLAVASRSHFQRILLHPDKEYVSLTTVRQARGLYDLFLKGAGPFGAISEANQTYIQQAIWIRNAIAHSSEAAERTFRDKVPGVASLPTNRRQPSAFLRHEFRVSPSQRRFDLYCGAFLSAATEMGQRWSAAS